MMKTTVLLFIVLLVIIILSAMSMQGKAQVEGGGPYIDVDRSGFALAWTVVQGRRVVCRSPFVNTKERRIECD